MAASSGETFTIKKNDTFPVLTVTLLNPDKSAFDLTGFSSVTAHIDLRDQVVSKAMVIDGDPTTGIVRYTFIVADWTGPTAIPDGSFNMEFEAKFGAVRATFPNGGHDTLKVVDDLANA